MEMIDLNQFIKPELLVLIPFLIGIGKIIKTSIINDRHIPLILIGVGVIMACAYLFVIGRETIGYALIMGVIQGILCAATAVLGHNILKQYSKKE